MHRSKLQAGPVLWPVLLLVLYACMREPLPGRLTVPEDAICFDTPVTRAGDGFRKGDSFLVWAAADDGMILMEAQEVVLGDDGWTYSPLKFWPEGRTVSFFAVSPADASRVWPDGGLLQVSAGTDAAVDVLAADTVDGTPGQPVRLDFRHILSKISVRGSLERAAPATKTVRIRTVTIGPLPGQGFCRKDGTWPPEMQTLQDSVIFSQAVFRTVGMEEETIADFYIPPATAGNNGRMTIEWEVYYKDTGLPAFARTDTVSLAGKSFLKSTVIGFNLSLDGRIGLIDFEDEETKRICVRHFDRDGDGELSYDEAAQVTAIENTCFLSSSITRFNELKYFTGLHQLDGNAFLYCRDLEAITLPPELWHLGSGAFAFCPSLREIDISQCTGTIGTGIFRGDKQLQRVVWPPSQRHIPSFTFQDCTSLVEMPRSSAKLIIDEGAFMGCTSLRHIDFHSIQQVGNWVFSDCTSLAAVDLSQYSGSFSTGMFEGCSFLQWVAMGDNVSAIPASMFFGCASLHEITFPTALRQVSAYAFYGCSSLEDIDLPKNVTSIGENAFGGCAKIRTVTSRAKSAPDTADNAFGSSADTYAGSLVSSDKKLRIPVLASGYNDGGWKVLVSDAGFKKNTVWTF